MLRILAMGVALLLAVAAGTEAQLQQARVTAIVLDADRSPLGGVRVTLTDPLGAELQSISTDPQGRAAFDAVASGRYELRAEPRGRPPLQLPVVVTGALPVEITMRVPAAVTDRVVVEGGRMDEASFRTSLGGESIARIPTRSRARALQNVVATLPGWATEDNGLLHARGVDDGFLYVMDGVPVYERLDAVSGLTPDLTAVSSINVISGYVPPEFGYKAGGVIEVRTASVGAWNGLAEIGGGSDAARDGALAFGGRIGRAGSVRVGLAGTSSDRYLDPVHPDNLHNSGGQSTMFGGWELAPAGANRLTVGWGAGGASFDVPNNEEQEEAGQHQRQQIDQAFLQTTWQRLWSPALVTQASIYHRRTAARLNGSPFDTPLEAHADRSLVRTGMLFAATRQFTAHLVKAGIEWQRLALDEAFRFGITDEDEAEEAGFREQALAFTQHQPFVFADRANRGLLAAYVQDSWMVGPSVTVSGGIRFDRSELLLVRTQVSPRVGLAWRAGEHTVVRTSLSRFFQPPQPEHLLLSSSPEARVLSAYSVGDAEGGADVEPERQWGAEIGLTRQLGRARLDVAYWARRIRHAADPNVFAGTTIIFPNAVARGRAHGVEARIEVPRSRGISGYANAAVGRIVQTGPITGGLFLEDEVEALGPGVEFAPDHDQRVTASGGVSWEHARSGALVSLTTRFESGTPIQQDDDDLDELLEMPGAEMVDFARGRVKPRTVVSLLLAAPVMRTDRMEALAGVQVLNLFDVRYAYNFGNPFSGTHFGAPRTMTVSLRLRFRP